MTPSIILKNISKSFNDKIVFNRVDLEISEPGIYLVVGYNGSGKSTLLKLIAGIYRASQGSIKLECNGKPCRTLYVPETPLSRGSPYTLMDLITILYNLGFANKPVVSPNIENILQKLGFSREDYYRELSLFSAGQRKKLLIGLVLSLSNTIDILLLDEPLANIDNKSWHIILSLLNNIYAKEKDKIVIITTHIIPSILRRLSIRKTFLVHEGSIIDTTRLMNLVLSSKIIEAPVDSLQIIDKLGIDYKVIAVDTDKARLMIREGFIQKVVEELVNHKLLPHIHDPSVSDLIQLYISSRNEAVQGG